MFFQIFSNLIFGDLTFRNDGQCLLKTHDMNLFKWEKTKKLLGHLYLMPETVSAV